MNTHQQTIRRPISLSGIGLHTGVASKLTFVPAPPGTGIRFRRVDLEGAPEIPALVDHVVEVARGTTLAIGQAKVHTVEHVLAATVGLQVDNLFIELTNVEPPIGDGSAKPFVDALTEAGLELQDAGRDYFVLDETLRYVDEKRGVDLVALPTPDYRLTVMIDYQNPVLGSQHTGLFNLEKEFVPEFSDARTFCFLHEVEALAAQGLIKGGNLDNAIVIVDNDIPESEMRRITKKLGIQESVVMAKSGILNNRRLRHKNEPARHKLLDLMGDLALAGVPLRAQILAARPGHAANVEFARKIRKLYLQKQLVGKYQSAGKAGVVFDAVALQNILPHRYPFLLVDRIVDFVLDERITGIKNVTVNDWFFEGHFPGQPIMPGVLIIEAMAQVGGLLLLNAVDDPTTKIAMFTSINNAKFRRPVVPGDQLVLEVALVRSRSRIALMSCKAFVAGELVAEAELSAAIVDRASALQKPPGNGVPAGQPGSAGSGPSPARG